MRSRHLLSSALAHIAAIAALLALLRPRPLPELASLAPLRIQVVQAPSSPELNRPRKPPGGPTAGGPSAAKQRALDLRPDFMKDEALGKPEPRDETPKAGTPYSRDLLYGESKVAQVFDQLAERINGHLEFPTMLAESGIFGSVTFDLYFDHQGEVDEAKSRTYGGNKFIRGLLVKAARSGLVDWLRSDAQRLRKDQFRDQHFRAEMMIIHSDIGAPPPAALAKTSSGYYSLSREFRSASTCVLDGMVDLACLVIRAGGAIHRTVSDKYKIELIALKDALENYDELGMSGVGAEARKG